jgi:hypothetical protein
LATKPDIARGNPPGCIEQPSDRKTGDGFARTALADEAKRLTFIE